MKTGLIMEGGAMRGLFTAGVTDVLMSHGVRFDGAIGVSAGAAFGCNYKSGQRGRVLRYNTRYCQDRRYCGLHALLTGGNIYSTDFCYGEVPLELDRFDFAAYESNPMEFYVVCTDLVTGKAVYHRWDSYADHGFDWIRASASMPLVSRMVEIDGHRYLDGGIADSIPVKFFQSLGYDRSVVILTRPRGYRKAENPALGLVRLKYRKYPALVDAMARRHIVYNATLDYIEREERAGRLLVIRPAVPLPVGRVERDPQRLRAAWGAGRRAAEAQLAEIQNYLKG